MLEFGSKAFKIAPVESNVCHRCRYWESGVGKPADVGLCHRSAPAQGGWPATGRMEWCGEFKASGETALQRTFGLLKLVLAVLVFALLFGLGVVRIWT